MRILYKESRKTNTGTSSLLATSSTDQVQFLWYLAVKTEVEEKMKEQDLGLWRQRWREKGWVVWVKKREREDIEEK